MAAEIAKKQLAIWNDPKAAAPFSLEVSLPNGHMDIDTMVLQSAVDPVGQPG